LVDHAKLVAAQFYVLFIKRNEPEDERRDNICEQQPVKNINDPERFYFNFILKNIV
jgi:hypothetical protein